MSKKIREDYNEKIKFYEERQELLKNISHDFRTPLTSILGYSISLDDGVFDDDEERKKYYRIIRKKAEYMSTLFDEMINLTKLDDNCITLKKADFDLSEFLKELVIEYIPYFQNEKFTVETSIAENIIYYGDRDLLSRAVRNLIDNVIKHSNNGKYFKLSLERAEKIIIKIIDRGNKISPNDKDKIFHKFYKNTKSKGMGVGLSITKEIIEKHNGSIILDTYNSIGNCFCVTL